MKNRLLMFGSLGVSLTQETLLRVHREAFADACPQLLQVASSDESP
jgi:hypothetical protein